MSDITQARKALVTRRLEEDGRASLDQRRAAFDNMGLTEPLRTLMKKVAKQPTTVTDAGASGLSEDQIFEIVVCVAVGQATRQYNTALAALGVAIGKE